MLEKTLHSLIFISKFKIMNYLADLTSLLRDGTVIEEEDRQGSSSDSSTCLVGTTTQGLDSPTPQKGKIFHVNMVECSVQEQVIYIYSECGCCDSQIRRFHVATPEVSDWVCFD